MWRIFDKLKDIAVVATKLDGKIARCSPAFGELFDEDPVHLKGRNIIDLTAPEYREMSRINFNVMASGETDEIRQEKIYIKKDGTEIKRMLHCFLVRHNKTQRPLYIIGFVYNFGKSDGDKADNATEKILLKIIETLNKRTGTVIMNQPTDNRVDNSIDAKNKSGTQSISVNPGNQSKYAWKVQISLIIGITIIAVTLLIVKYGGGFSAQRGDTTIKIEGGNSEKDNNDPE